MSVRCTGGHYEITHQSGTVTFGRDTILNETTAGDEAWAVLQIHHPYSPPNACFGQNLLPMNLVVIVAWDVQGGFNVMPFQGMEWNAWYYMLFLQYHLNGASREKHPELVENDVIVCDKGAAHSADTVKNVL
jgi:hypothetical protein